MRLTRSICAVTLIAAAACSGGLTAPPSGLPVDLSFVESDVQTPSITSDADSVVAIVNEAPQFACADGPPSAAAGIRGSDLIVTVSAQVVHTTCGPVGALAAVVPLPIRLVVHEVPAGTDSARVVLRRISGDNATYIELGSGPITVQ
ncbi:MAG TPA: hypothetical protein VLD17_01595 [Gemmatimonadaceae bacterium]|nr:hypothetical protein [Gemmatimonadaceae bacterium]